MKSHIFLEVPSLNIAIELLGLLNYKMMKSHIFLKGPSLNIAFELLGHPPSLKSSVHGPNLEVFTMNTWKIGVWRPKMCVPVAPTNFKKYEA